MNLPRRIAALAAVALAALVLPACAAGASVTRQSMFDSAPADLDVQAVTIEVTGRRSTLFGDEEAEARLRRVPGVHQVAHSGGRNSFVVLTDTTLSPEALVMALDGDFRVYVAEVVRRPPKP